MYTYRGDHFMENIEKRINEVLDKLKPYLMSDGGNLEFVKFENGIVYIKLLGACSHCSMMEITLKEGIEEALINEIPEVQKVERVDD